MSRIYTVSGSFDITAANGDHDLVYIAPADDKPCKLRGFTISQSTEFGDAQEENLRISIIRLPATVTASSGGTAGTAQPLDTADAAAGATVRYGDTVVATTTGTAITLAEYGWNERGTPWSEWFPDERFCPKAKQGEALVIRNQTTVADTITCQVTAWIEEE